MKRLFLVIFSLQALLTWAQSSDSITDVAPDTIYNIVQGDTIFSEQLIETSNAEQLQEDILMELLAKQGQEIARKNALLEAQIDSINSANNSSINFKIDSSYLALNDSMKQEFIDSLIFEDELNYTNIIVDSAYIKRYNEISKRANPLLKELVFMPIELKMDWDLSPNFSQAYFGTAPKSLRRKRELPQYQIWEDKITKDLHTETRRKLTRENADLYATTFMELPNTEMFIGGYVKVKDTRKLNVVVKEKEKKAEKIDVEEIKIKHWIFKGSALAQFTQHYISDNWYKGGNSNVSILGIVTGNANYDNKKNIQWENFGEWRAGFNSVEGDTLRKIATNNDLFRLYSKLGVKAFGKFYYTASAEFKTQLFNTYKGANSPVLKTSIFSPIQTYVNVGLDYKPNKDLSIMLAPVSYKFVYVNDTVKVAQTSFGVEKGKQTLHDIGSSLRIEYTYKPIEEIVIATKLYCFTNYEKVEIDWEIECNFIINRYLSARVMLHPRFDNTAIADDDEKAKIQFQELISVGFSHKF